MTKASGLGIVNKSDSQKVLSVRFFELSVDGEIKWRAQNSKPSSKISSKVSSKINAEKLVEISAEIETPPKSAEDVFLRLTLLSRLIFQPNSINLDGLFDHLNTVVSTNFGEFLVDEFEAKSEEIEEKYGQRPVVNSVDKIPRMIDFVVPEAVRIADPSRVRLGAHLSRGTTVMHEGFCNFNAGTLGVSMVEGRISQGVIVEDGADIGGGASIMGTLSGGGKERVRIGKRSLLGANAGLGIALGDDCIVESGLYLTAASKVLHNGEIVKARELSGMNNLLFIRNSQTGAIEARVRKQAPGIELNSALHKN